MCLPSATPTPTLPTSLSTTQLRHLEQNYSIHPSKNTQTGLRTPPPQPTPTLPPQPSKSRAPRARLQLRQAELLAQIQHLEAQPAWVQDDPKFVRKKVELESTYVSRHHH
jgi:hypothetical protein